MGRMSEEGGRMMLTKTRQVQLKAVGDKGAPVFEGYAAVFGNVDLGGDMIVKGAFADTLAGRYPDGGAGIPVYWNHNTDDPFANLGVTSTAVEDDHGLLVTAEVDTSTDYGQQVAKLLRGQRVTQMSFAFNVTEGAFVESDEHGYYYELRKLDLFEVSVVPIGMNQATEITSVKALMEKRQPGDVLDDLRAAVDAATEILREKASTDEVDEVPSGADSGGAFARRETAARALRALDL